MLTAYRRTQLPETESRAIWRSIPLIERHSQVRFTYKGKPLKVAVANMRSVFVLLRSKTKNTVHLPNALLLITPINAF
jgi:hypothetical protein